MDEPRGYAFITLENRRVYAHFGKVDVLSLVPFIWGSATAREFLVSRLDVAKNKANRLFVQHIRVDGSSHYFVDLDKVKNVLYEVTRGSCLDEAFSLDAFFEENDDESDDGKMKWYRIKHLLDGRSQVYDALEFIKRKAQEARKLLDKFDGGAQNYLEQQEDHASLVEFVNSL